MIEKYCMKTFHLSSLLKWSSWKVLVRKHFKHLVFTWQSKKYIFFQTKIKINLIKRTDPSQSGQEIVGS